MQKMQRNRLGLELPTDLTALTELAALSSFSKWVVGREKVRTGRWKKGSCTCWPHQLNHCLHKFSLQVVSSVFSCLHLATSEMSCRPGGTVCQYNGAQWHKQFTLTRDIDIANMSICPSVCLLSVRPLRCGILWKRHNVLSQFFSSYGNPIILVLSASNIFTKFQRGHPLRGTQAFEWYQLKWSWVTSNARFQGHDLFNAR